MDSLSKSDSLKVSVHMITYNHETLIEEAIKSVINQKTDFKFELVIGEDCSTDSTRKLVRQYANRFPDVIRALLPAKNLGRHGENNFLHTLASCNGEYIAFIEGDDFWTNQDKLQIQKDYLDANPDMVGCFHNAVVVDAEGSLIQEEWFNEECRQQTGYKQRFNQYDCLYTLRSSYPSCSLMIRRNAVAHLPDWYLLSPTDYATDILVTEYGDLAYLPLNMAAYRVHENGVWQGMTYLDQRIELFRRYRLLIQTPIFKQRYGDTLSKMMGAELRIAAGISFEDNSKLSLEIILAHLLYVNDNVNDICYSFQFLLQQLQLRVAPDLIVDAIFIKMMDSCNILCYRLKTLSNQFSSINFLLRVSRRFVRKYTLRVFQLIY